MQVLKKERIKDRMLKTTARLWAIPENEVETNYDPLILLMLDACASELEKLGYDVNASQARLMDKLAELMLPEALLGPAPASCIVHATPIDAAAKLQADTKFYTNQRITTADGKQLNTDFYFTPVGAFTLHKAKLQNVIVGSKVYGVGENNSRTTIHRGDGNEHMSVSELWLAFSADKAVANLKGLSVFFDMRGHSEANAFYKSIEGSAAFINGQKVELLPGFYEQQQFDLSPEEMLVSGHDYIKKICRKVAGVYQRQFMHIADSVGNNATTLPQELISRLPDAAVKQLDAEPKIYLKIELTRPFTADVLDGLVCSINAFPVINRRFNTMNYRTDSWVNIIPLQVDGHFLDLNEIAGSSGNRYSMNAQSTQNMEEGEAQVRSSGIGKTDSKEVREIIGSLMEAIRDESAYFTEISNEFLLARLREVSQILARLEDQLAAAKNNRMPHHYVLLRPKQAGDQVAVSYWTTNAEDANKIKSGSAMVAFNHTLVDPKSTITITTTVGGQSGFTESEKRILLKQQLVSKGKIVSAEDVKLLCFQLFGDRLKQVEVKKGIRIGSNKSEGYVRTVEVHLQLQQGLKESRPDEVGYLCAALENQLAENAAPIYPFSVFVN